MDELLALERRFWEAGGDPGFYRERFAEDGRCVFAFGILDKDATVASMEVAGGWSSVEFSELSCLDLAPDVAALAYLADAVSDDGGTYHAAVSSVYVRRDGHWQLVLHQQSEP